MLRSNLPSKRWHPSQARTVSCPSPQREKLLYFVLLRQVETPSVWLSEAYQRLADAASAADGWDLRTVILDWLETELRCLRASGDDKDHHGIQLMKSAVALSNALAQ